jgi:hypothetical protein
MMMRAHLPGRDGEALDARRDLASEHVPAFVFLVLEHRSH